MSEHYCLRCRTVLLAETEHYHKNERSRGIRFFLCSNCGRRYALEAGKALTFRWREAVTFPLNEIYPYDAPVEYAARKLASLCRSGLPRSWTGS